MGGLTIAICLAEAVKLSKLYSTRPNRLKELFSDALLLFFRFLPVEGEHFFFSHWTKVKWLFRSFTCLPSLARGSLGKCESGKRLEGSGSLSKVVTSQRKAPTPNGHHSFINNLEPTLENTFLPLLGHVAKHFDDHECKKILPYLRLN